MIEVALMMDPPLLDLLPFIEVLQLLIIISFLKIFCSMGNKSLWNFIKNN